MRILIIEDEQSSADRLRRMLEGEHEMVGVCASNAEVKDFFGDASHADVDLILSDIQLGDGLSFESLKTVPTAIPVIFTTAYDQYAVQAFQFNSIDYLLKPIDSEELQAALEQVHSSQFIVHSSTTDAISQILASVKSQTIRYRERFLIPHRADEYLIVPVSDVSHITIRDGVVRLCTLDGKTHALNMTLEEAESQLDPQRFMRVNRQFIVSATAVSKLSTYFLGKMRIQVAAFPTVEIIVSKDKVATVKRWLDS
ncbi:MAG: LytTR family DNA-binding domain-containing protein [Bacteroidaceae bacterium]|nr:LytTR family DNA-binding domain-containing protein [Bacteroidaceae bacterium]